MPDESEKQRRKAIRHKLRSAEKLKAEMGLPAPKDQLEDLFQWVGENLGNGCDHTLRYTVRYIHENGLDEERTLQWLREFGGYCDCEVVMNVEDSCPAFK